VCLGRMLRGSKKIMEDQGVEPQGCAACRSVRVGAETEQERNVLGATYSPGEGGVENTRSEPPM